MASCITSQFGNSNCPQVRLTVTESSSATTSTLAWTLEYVAHGFAASTSTAKSYTAVVAGETVASGTYNINGKTGTYTIASGSKVITKTTASQSISFSCSMAFNLTWSGTYGGTKSASGSITIGALTSYTISYNANGGSGAPGSQTKWAGTNLTLSATRPTRTGYSFLGWSTSSAATSATYAAGATYTANASAALYAVWKADTYTVSYNANGGAGAPGSQTKTYGVTLQLSTAEPSRSNYTFLGWGTSASSTTVAYAAGANYTANAGVTLYAIWQLAYTAPRITNFTADRCTSAGSLAEDGTYAMVRFNWACDKAVSSLKIEWKLSSASSYSSTTVTGSGTSGTVSCVIGAGALSAELIYDIRVTVSDGTGSSNASRTLASMAYPIDFLAGGKGVSIGKVATRENAFDSAWPIYEQNSRIYSPNNKPTCADVGAVKGNVDSSGYVGLAAPDGNTATYIKTPQSGILPYQSGGSGAVGSDQWRFNTGYFVNLNCSGTSRATGGFTSDSTCFLVPQSSNEVNFKTNGSQGVWFGYRKAGDNAINTYHFGNCTNGGYGNIYVGTGYFNVIQFSSTGDNIKFNGTTIVSNAGGGSQWFVYDLGSYSNSAGSILRFNANGNSLHFGKWVAFEQGSNLSSSLTKKTNIRSLDDIGVNPLRVVRQTPIYQYHYTAGLERNYWHPQIGFVSELSPGEITTPQKDGIEISNALGIAYGAIQQVADKTDQNAVEIAAIWEYLEEVTKNGAAN